MHTVQGKYPDQPVFFPATADRWFPPGLWITPQYQVPHKGLEVIYNVLCRPSVPQRLGKKGRQQGALDELCIRGERMHPPPPFPFDHLLQARAGAFTEERKTNPRESCANHAPPLDNSCPVFFPFQG